MMQEACIKTINDHKIAIFLDDTELISPGVNKPILGGAAFIDSPAFTLNRVSDLSLMLESGRLPVPIKLIQERENELNMINNT